MKLNYLQVNDIIGISEVMSDGKYAFTIACSSKTASIYEVNGHIIRLLIESDKIIHDNKDRILMGIWMLHGFSGIAYILILLFIPNIWF